MSGHTAWNAPRLLPRGDCWQQAIFLSHASLQVYSAYSSKWLTEGGVMLVVLFMPAADMNLQRS